MSSPKPAKSQWIRVLDVAVIGPLMMWGGLVAGGTMGKLLMFFGVTTTGYNLINYVRVERSDGRLE